MPGVADHRAIQDAAGPRAPLLLDESHRGEIARHLLLLPEEQRYTRFFGAMSDEAIGSFVARLDFADDLLVALPGAHAGGFRGVVQASRHAPEAWELAFSTAPAYQRQGIATLLGRWMIERLTAGGATQAYIFCAPKNIAMRGLARKLGFSVRVEDGEVTAQRTLEAGAAGGG